MNVKKLLISLFIFSWSLESLLRYGNLPYVTTSSKRHMPSVKFRPRGKGRKRYRVVKRIVRRKKKSPRYFYRKLDGEDVAEGDANYDP